MVVKTGNTTATGTVGSSADLLLISTSFNSICWHPTSHLLEAVDLSPMTVNHILEGKTITGHSEEYEFLVLVGLREGSRGDLDFRRGLCQVQGSKEERHLEYIAYDVFCDSTKEMMNKVLTSHALQERVTVGSRTCIDLDMFGKEHVEARDGFEFLLGWNECGELESRLELCQLWSKEGLETHFAFGDIWTVDYVLTSHDLQEWVVVGNNDSTELGLLCTEQGTGHEEWVWEDSDLLSYRTRKRVGMVFNRCALQELTVLIMARRRTCIELEVVETEQAQVELNAVVVFLPGLREGGYRDSRPDGLCKEVNVKLLAYSAICSRFNEVGVGRKRACMGLDMFEQVRKDSIRQSKYHLSKVCFKHF